MRVLITGGAGYIGSTVASACLDAGYEVAILDNLSEGRREFTRDRRFYAGDIADAALLRRIADDGPVDAVIHCAARIVVPESTSDPLGYYENNVGKTLDLLACLADLHVPRVVFSSSASIYGNPVDGLGVREESPLAPSSPYARTKLQMEQILADVAAAGGPRAIALRYFNPIGADPQLRTGQQREHPTHVLGRMMDAWLADGRFTVTGTDWPTPDGSGVRDYIHVWDLALVHVAALARFDSVTADAPFVPINVGTGHGVSVLNLVDIFQQVTGRPLKVARGPRRPGDVLGAYAICDRAASLLNWRATRSVADGIRDALAWLPRRQQLLGY